MKIDLDKILAFVKPMPVEVAYDGRSYRLRRLSIADVTALETIDAKVEGEDETVTSQRVMGYLVGAFDGDAPPFLSVDLKSVKEDERQRIALLAVATLQAVSAVFVARMRDDAKKLALAAEEAHRQVLPASPETPIDSAARTSSSSD